jgi:hypothetical protein
VRPYRRADFGAKIAEGAREVQNDPASSPPISVANRREPAEVRNLSVAYGSIRAVRE